MCSLIIRTAPMAGTVVADSYYACRTMLQGLLARGFHIIGRVRMNTVAYKPAPPAGRTRRGRPRRLGEKVIYARPIHLRLPMWLRTLRPQIPPSENLVRSALQAERLRISGGNNHRSLLSEILATRAKADLPPHPLRLVA